MCYGGKSPTNDLLAQSRADNLKAVIGKYLGKELTAAGATIKTKTLLKQPQRYVKVEGLVFNKSYTYEKMVSQVNCGDKVEIQNGKQGNASKNYLFQDLPEIQNTDYTRAIAVYGKNSVKVTFNPLQVPDRFELYGVPKSDKTKRERLDKGDGSFIGSLMNFAEGKDKKYTSSFPYAVYANYNKKQNIKLSDPLEQELINMTEDYLKSKKQGYEYYRIFQQTPSMVSTAEKIWVEYLKQGTNLSSPKVKFKHGGIYETYSIKGKDYSHVVVKVFSPFEGTVFKIDTSCE